MVEVEPLRSGIGPDPDPDSGLLHICEKGSQKTVPEGKDGAVVGVSLFYDDGMVYPVHGRGYKENPKEAFKALGDRQAAVVKLGTEDEGRFKDQDTRQGRPKKKYERYLDNGGNGQFPNVETGGGGDVHVEIGVMDPVKPPEQRDFMVQQMPHIEHEIHEGDG